MRGFSGGSGGKDSKECACNPGDLGSDAGSGRSAGEGDGHLLQRSCLENSMDRGAWWVTILHEIQVRMKRSFGFIIILIKGTFHLFYRQYQYNQMIP